MLAILRARKKLTFDLNKNAYLVIVLQCRPESHSDYRASHPLAMSESAQKGHRLTALLSQCNSHIPAAEQRKCEIVPHANRMERGTACL